MPQELLYLALGDSTAAGVGAANGGGYPDRLLLRLLASRPGLRLLNLAQSGATTHDVLESQLPDALKLRPALITLGVGINDVGMLLPEESFAVNLEEVVGRLGRLDAKLAIANIPDLALAPAMARNSSTYLRRIELFNEHLEATAARHGAALIDLFSLSRKLIPEQQSLFSPDGFHPSATGYDAWADAMLPQIELLLGDRRGEARCL